MIEKLAGALSKKCRWFDIIETRGSSTPISFKNSRLYSISEKENSGFGIRVNIKNRTGFSYTNDVTKLQNTAERALALAPYGDTESFDLPESVPGGSEPYSDLIDSFDIKSEIAQAENAIASLLAEFPGASIDLSINRSAGTMRLINSGGFDSSYRNSYYSVSLSLTNILDDGSKIDVWEGASFLYPSPYDHIIKKLTRSVLNALQVKTCLSGKVPVLFTPKACSRILGIVAAGLNAKSVWKGISPFGDKLGSAVFSGNLSLFDDPLFPDSPYSYPFDDEGTPARKKALIEGGVVTNFITDLKHAEKLGIEPGGNGARGYASLPHPSFSNTIIGSGEKTFDEMIKDIELGVLVDQFIGLGQSNTLTGDFSANLDLAFLIEKGVVTGRVKDCMLSDNIFQLLTGDIHMSRERERSGSTLAPYLYIPAVNYTC